MTREVASRGLPARPASANFCATRTTPRLERRAERGGGQARHKRPVRAQIRSAHKLRARVDRALCWRGDGPPDAELRPEPGARHGARGGRGPAALPADARPREARRPLRRPLPHHRHRPLELRQLGPVAHQGAHAVQERVARGAHRAQLAARAHPRSVHRGDPGAAAHRARRGTAARPTPSGSASTSSTTSSPSSCASSAATTSTRWTCARWSLFHQEAKRRRDRRGHPRPAARGARLRRPRGRRGRAHRRLPREGREPADDAGQREHVPRLDGQLHLRPRRAPARAPRGREPRGEPPRLRPRHLAAHGRRRAARSTRTTSRPTRCPGEEEHDSGYWRDIGTIDAYWEAQMDLIEIHPQFNLYNFRWPIRTGRDARPAGEVRLPRRGAGARRHRDRLAGQPRMHHLRRAHPPERPRRRLPRELVQRGRGERPLRGRAASAGTRRSAAPSSTRTSRFPRAPSSASTARPTASASS